MASRLATIITSLLVTATVTTAMASAVGAQDLLVTPYTANSSGASISAVCGPELGTITVGYHPVENEPTARNVQIRTPDGTPVLNRTDLPDWFQTIAFSGVGTLRYGGDVFDLDASVCAPATTTTTVPETTTTTIPVTTSTTVPESTTTTVPVSTTTTAPTSSTTVPMTVTSSTVVDRTTTTTTAPTTDVTLPETGAGSGFGLVIGVAAVAGGAGLVLFARGIRR